MQPRLIAALQSMDLTCIVHGQHSKFKTTFIFGTRSSLVFREKLGQHVKQALPEDLKHIFLGGLGRNFYQAFQRPLLHTNLGCRK